MTATLTSEEAKVFNDIVVEELADFGLMKAVEDKTAAAREIAHEVAKRFESHPLRQLENLPSGSPATRARQSILKQKFNFLSFKIKFEPTFFRNVRIC